MPHPSSPPPPPRRVWLWWSTGKDSAWSLHRLRADPGWRVERLVTTVTPSLGRVAIHGTRIAILREQAAATGLPLSMIELPRPCPNEAYEAAVRPVVERAAAAGVDAMAFGDLFLEEIREYRAALLEGSGVEPIFPIWGRDTGELAREMIAGGVEARVVALDPARVPRRLLGHPFDDDFLAALDPEVDPCGEYGEFHSCVTDAPDFSTRIEVTDGIDVERESFCYHDLELAGVR